MGAHAAINTTIKTMLVDCLLMIAPPWNLMFALNGASKGDGILVQCLHRYPLLHRLSAALVQFNHVAIRVAHEDSLRSGPEADRAAAQRDTRRLEPLLRGHDVGAQEGKVRDAG